MSAKINAEFVRGLEEAVAPVKGSAFATWNNNAVTNRNPWLRRRSQRAAERRQLKQEIQEAEKKGRHLVVREGVELAIELSVARKKRREKREKAQARQDAANEGLKQTRLAWQRNLSTERADLSGDLWHGYERERVDASHVVHLSVAVLDALPGECGVFEYPEDCGDFERRRSRYTYSIDRRHDDYQNESQYDINQYDAARGVGTHPATGRCSL